MFICINRPNLYYLSLCAKFRTENQMAHSQDPKSHPSILCRAGCGFFGAQNTGGFCSKCFKTQSAPPQDLAADLTPDVPTSLGANWGFAKHFEQKPPVFWAPKNPQPARHKMEGCDFGSCEWAIWFSVLNLAQRDK